MSPATDYDDRPRRSHRSRKDDYSSDDDTDVKVPRTDGTYDRPKNTRYDNPRNSDPSLDTRHRGDGSRDRHRSKPSRRARDYDSESEDDYDDDRRPPRRSGGGSGGGHRSGGSAGRGGSGGGRKSFGEQAMESLGIGTTSDRGNNRSTRRDRRSRRYSSEDDYSDDDYYRRDRGARRGNDRRANDGPGQIGQAAQAAFTAAALEAWKARKAPGGWTGEKGRRILTAAAGAGGIDSLQDRDGEKHGLGNVLTSAIGGLATNRLANGPVSQSRGHGRSRSETGGGDRGLKDLAAGAIAAGLGKKIVDSRSKSRERDRRRDRDYTPSDSEDDYRSRASRSSRRAPPPQRSKSITDQFRGRLAEGLASFGLGDVAKKIDPREDPRNNAGRRTRELPREDRQMAKDAYDRQVQRRSRSVVGNGAVTTSRARRGSASSVSSSDKGHDDQTDPEKSDYDSDVARRKHKKLREKEVLNGALATVATVHSVHSLMEAKEARQRRHAKVISGELTPAQAKVEARKATAKDLATIGIAAYGAKGAYSAWKEMTEKHKELQDFDKHAHECRRQRVEKNREEIARLNRQVQDLSVNQQRLIGQGEYAGGGVHSPTYNDANPYAGMVPPEVTYQGAPHY